MHIYMQPSPEFLINIVQFRILYTPMWKRRNILS